ncbi:MAG TPA: hypothetical protein PLE68_06160 [Bacillota bacterium]|nr:hypothetical protein [Bacillota bacterium]
MKIDGANDEGRLRNCHDQKVVIAYYSALFDNPLAAYTKRFFTNGKAGNGSGPGSDGWSSGRKPG